MGIPLLKPMLYAGSASGPVLLGAQCRCGYVFFPLQTFGCEKCGAQGDAIASKTLQAVGTLVTAAHVHMHADKRRTAPFAIGTIKLDDGPVIRTMLSNTQMAGELGIRVQGEWVQVTSDEGRAAMDLRFNRVST
jgi:uncharacterized protein